MFNIVKQAFISSIWTVLWECRNRKNESNWQKKMGEAWEDSMTRSDPGEECGWWAGREIQANGKYEQSPRGIKLHSEGKNNKCLVWLEWVDQGMEGYEEKLKGNVEDSSSQMILHLRIRSIGRHDPERYG